MKPAPEPLHAAPVTRRRFLNATALATALTPFATRTLGADPSARLKAAVIGHTGRGGKAASSTSTARKVGINDVYLLTPRADG